jgi:hypothetical protein
MVAAIAVFSDPFIALLSMHLGLKPSKAFGSPDIYPA